MSSLPVSDPTRRQQLKKRNPTTWHLKTPEQGPATLAIKNRESMSSHRAATLTLGTDFIAMLGEYVGTVLFMIFALGGTK